MASLSAQYDVLIAGAGPAGSATATLLARAGFSVLLVDRASFPRDKACSEYMSPEAVRILARLGVLESLERAGAFPLEGMKVTAPRGATAHGKFSGAARAFRPTGLSISRRVLDHQLLAAARQAGVTVLERTLLEDLLFEGMAVTGVVVRDRDSQQRQYLRARLVVGADGLRSIVARKLGYREHGLRRMAFVAHVADVRGMTPSAELHFRDHGYVGLNQIGHGQTNVAVVVPAEQAREVSGGADHFFEHSLRSFPEVQERVHAGRIVRRVLATGPFAVRSSRIVADGAVLVGDAADFFDPATGDGIYSALRGGELLAHTAAEALQQPGRVMANRLMGYQRSRRRVFARKWLFERVLDKALRFPRLLDFGVSRLGRRPGVADTLIGFAGGCVAPRQVLNPVFLARMLA